MSRPLRIEMANGLYHVTALGGQRWVIVDSDREREDWLRLLDRVATWCNWRVFSWVLMTNHFHRTRPFYVGPSAQRAACAHGKAHQRLVGRDAAGFRGCGWRR